MAKFVKTIGLHNLGDKVDKEATEMTLKLLSYIGEDAVREARLRGSYTDQTGMLRSSINYGVYRFGREHEIGTPEKYPPKAHTATDAAPKKGRKAKKTSGKSEEGAKAGIDAVRAARSSSADTDFALILTAGANYASFVENIHHKDVLISGEQKARETAARLLGKPSS